MIIKTKKRISLTIVMILLLLFFIFISYLLIKDFYFPIKFSNIKELIGSIILLLLSFMIIYHHLKIPNIELNNNTIIFKTLFTKKQYFLKDINSFELSDKMPLKWIFITFPVEGMYLEFNDEKIEFIYDDFYSNLWEIKNYINKLKNKSEHKRLKQTKSYFKSNTRIKGSVLTSYSLIVIFLILFTLFLILKMDLSNFHVGSLIGISIFLLLLGSFSNLLYYYEFNHDKLIVKNHLFFWFEKIYETNNIKEIAIENPSVKVPDGLRIVSNDFQTKLYMSGSYKNGHWIEIIKIINQTNIKLRNESLWHLENNENG